MNNDEIGNRIKNQRLELGLTLQDVAGEIGVTKTTILRYERGEIETLKLPVVEAIARVLRVSPAWLIGKSEKKEPLPDLNAREERDIAKRMDRLRAELVSEDGLMFDGVPMDEETIDFVVSALEMNLRAARSINKEKYTKKGDKGTGRVGNKRPSE